MKYLIRPLYWRALFSQLVLVFFWLISMGANAATYNLPGALGMAPFVGCSLSGTSINCTGSVMISGGDTVTSGAAYSFNIAGNFSMASSGTWGTAANKLNVTTGGEFTVGGPGGALFYGDVTTSSSSATAVNINNKTDIYGNISATNGTVNIGNSNNITINGNVIADIINTGGSSNIIGTCVAQNGVVPLQCTGGGGSFPIVATAAATSITSTTATLNGTVNPNGFATSPITFAYGTTTAYGSTANGSPSTLAFSAPTTSISSSITGLSCGTTYNFYIYATNSRGTTNGSNLTFTTSACPAPLVTTAAATSVASTSATLNASVTANGSSTAVTFEYGTSTGAYSTTGLAATGSPVAVSGTPSYSLSGLACNTTYYFRVKGVSSSGTSYGSELNFKTSGCLSDFDAYETSFTSPTAAAAKIYTHVASSSPICVSGGSCSLKIGSFNPGTRVLKTSFTGPVKLELVDASSGSCASFGSITTWKSSQTLSSTGETTLALPAIVLSYPNVRVRISYPATGTVTNQNCSSDSFAIRPASFSVLVQDADSSTAGTSRTLSTSTITGAPSHRAGSPMTVTLKALTLEGATVSSYAGNPSFALSSCVGTSCASSFGVLSNAVGTFSSGSYVSNIATYSDVGSFVATLTDSSFASVDSADGTPAAVTHLSGSATVGRFIPHHFDVVPIQGCTLGSTSFTYSGQPFAMSVTARNQSGGTTANYSALAGLSKAVTLAAQGASPGTLSITSLASTNFTAGAATILSSGGQSYTYTAKQTAPSTLSIRAADPDLVSSNSSFGGSEAGLLIRSGRLRAFGATGGDSAAIVVPLALQYHDGSTWVTNGDDLCTTLNASNIAMTSATNPLATYTPAPPVLASGSGYVSIAPTAISGSPSGGVNLAINLGSSGVDQSCNPVHSGVAAGKPWLRSNFGSCSAAADRDPAATLKFGSYTNESKRQVYIREIR